VAAIKGGLDLEAEEGRMPRWRELPFESRRKRHEHDPFCSHQDLSNIGSRLRSTENPPCFMSSSKDRRKKYWICVLRIQLNDQSCH